LPFEPGQTLLHYRLVEQIGEGGMGVVWKAIDTVLDREVAIKFLPEAFRQDVERLSRFKREARLLASLNHANIAAIHGLHEVEGIGFLCMELVPGEDLAQRLRSGPLPVEEALAMGVQVAEALEATHEAGVIHRDLKPANVSIAPNGRVKILDFGLAKSLAAPFEDDSGSAPTVSSAPTRDNQVMGTVAYMSPEQARGKALDERSDIWAFGCVLYETISGRPAFGGETASDRLAAVLKEEPDWSKLPNATPASLRQVLERCLNKDSAKRPRSMSEVREALASIRAGVDTASMPTLAAESAPTDKSIAVLPFANMTSDTEQDYFCEGIAEELIIGLGRIVDLRVAARTSAFQFKGSGFDIREVGERLNVDTILEGSVRKAGNRLRITAQLINVADGYRLWSERYDRTMDDIFAIQDEIAENIIRRLEVTLRPFERRALHSPAAKNVEAYDFYLRGRKFFHRWERKSWEFAIEMYERAIERDPQYARAYAGIAESSVSLFVYVGADEAMSRRADEASRKALELAPDLSEAHAARGLVLSWLLGQPEAAVEHFERAIELDPKLYENYYFYARSSAGQGEYERAARLYEKAIELRPDDYQAPLLVPQVYRSLGRDADAEAAERRGIELAERHVALNPGDIRALVLGSSILVAMGQQDKGLDWAQRALKLAPRETMVLYNVACTYSVAGKIDEALDYLERTIEEGYRQKSWIETDSEFESLRGHPRYRKILDRIDAPS
jgi:serine/threonine protein kinase/tetratricopeptide (TPR) repeat protein